jgi:D,D-heptose 1,7-bisphosphate phosphatase
MKIVIIAGGKGTRISSVTKEVPKAMIPINGIPVLEYQILLAKRYGHTKIILIIGHLGEKIQEYFGDGSKWGVEITYFIEKVPLGTAGALSELQHLLDDEFFVFYGDTVMDIDMDTMIDFHKSHSEGSTLLLHPNDHPYDSDLVDLGQNNRINQFFLKPHPDCLITRNLVNAALYILSPKILSLIPKSTKSDFTKDIFPRCIENGLDLFGYISPEYIKDMGTPERYDKVCNDVFTGKVYNLNRKYSRYAVFLDRDGVVTKEVNLLRNPDQLELIEGAAEAIQYINKKGYLVIMITNQPVIARNLCSLDELDYIHKKMETMLGRKHAYIDAIYFCPHHPDGGFPEERKEFKIECNCRKPKPGMLMKAAKDWNIDLSNSYMIGDRITDIQAGDYAGVKQSILVECNRPNNLLEIIKKLL